ncbi:phBC6A51 family helix-turn-helix protein [Clostridium tagluense]|uniref:phBC6A51 family helix-turn-helix protein n=1 Tax=Clostridium tagluense TaxID=360422 RepID=UPI001C6F2E1D|nr:phBC6A51 family helix-turn-helix protein [Clostridium tagluense]MBW9158886.1 helix-turn-helix domain-containing protein [Clostridium tagluense]WLC67137.1 hypothetical protein KTC93_08150 [Clostridium tagluense]
MLDERQIKAVEAKAKGFTITDMAKEAGVSRNTIYEWIKMEEFTAEVVRFQQEFVSQAQGRLKVAAQDAADEMIKLLKKGKYEKTRLSAAQDILDRNLGKATSRVEVDDGRKDKNNVGIDVLESEIKEFECK